MDNIGSVFYRDGKCAVGFAGLTGNERAVFLLKNANIGQSDRFFGGLVDEFARYGAGARLRGCLCLCRENGNQQEGKEIKYLFHIVRVINNSLFLLVRFFFVCQN